MPFDTTTTDQLDTDDAVQPTGRLSGSSQQRAFWDALINGSDHILLDARAGCGKSSSAREGMHRLTESGGNPSIRYTCFNKAIAEEFRQGCPPGVDVGTMHSFGFQALRNAFGSQLDAQKTYTIIDQLGGDKLKGYVRRSIARLVSAIKGFEPMQNPLWAFMDTVAAYHDIPLWWQDALIFDWTTRVIWASDDCPNIVDFDDMLRIPVVYGINFPLIDYLFIDEAQDLSPIQHAMAEQLSGSGRTIIIGDEKQAIYAFRGADSNSIPRLRERLNAAVFPLTVTRRCPKSHVDLARQLVPDFEAASEAPDGILESGDEGSLSQAGPGDLVLCRMNAPLIQHCLHAVASRRKATVRGRAIGDSLQAIVRRLDDPRTIADFQRALGRWKSRQLANLKGKDGAESLVEKVMDQAMCLDAIAGSCDSPAEITGVIDQLFSECSTADRITFSSIHRAKGSEATNVYLVDIPFSANRDREKPPADWELTQRRNLKYVSYTRSRNKLTIINPR
jgi:DNA helicase II / ATP-dependent DNA helicase PcrA